MIKFRRIAAAALTGALGVSLAAPAAAESSGADVRLTEVTRAVKGILDIGDEYTEFYGEPSETMLGERWELNWSSEDQNLYVSASDNGKVLHYNRSTMTASRPEQSFGPGFPATSQDQAREVAKSFLNRVLSEGEKAVFNPNGESAKTLNVGSYRFGGTVELNGLPTPMGFRIWVSADTGEVSNFWRDDESDYAGSVPNVNSVTTNTAARSLLRDTLNLELIYVRDKEGEQAVLRYVPQVTDQFYVSADTGELVNLTELREEMVKHAGDGGNSGGMGGAAYDTAATIAEAPQTEEEENRKLTEAEEAGIAKLEGVLSKEELDGKIRTWAALKLDGFQLAQCHYAVERADPDAPVKEEPAVVTATLSYAKKAENTTSHRTVTVDARTGELKSMFGYNPYRNAPVKVDKKDAQALGEDFLKALWGEQYTLTECYTSTAAETLGGTHRFTFAQKVNGYFFPENVLQIQISAEDGAVIGFTKNFDESVTFDSAEGLVSLDDAKTAWAEGHPVDLAYIAVPVELNLLGEEVLPLIDAGWSYYYALRGGYALGEPERVCTGVNAKTGKLVEEPEKTVEEAVYRDLEGHWSKAALEELAEYGVGWFGGKADPDGALNQLDYLALLVSTEGYRYIPGGSKNADRLYDYAVRRGLLTREERNDSKILTRGEMVKMLLDSMGFEMVANLKGIFQCAFSDVGDIPEGLLGYAALAQGLGLIKGDASGNFAPQRSSTRAEAAVMLWQYMKR